MDGAAVVQRHRCRDAALTGPAAQLAGTAERLADRLDRRLVAIGERHDLDRRNLLVAHREIERLARVGRLPTPNDYWHRWAVPRAAILVDASVAAIVDEAHRLARALDAFLAARGQGVHLAEPPGCHRDRGDAGAAAGPAGGALRDQGPDGVAVASLAIATLGRAVPTPAAIDHLGAWWHRRLRRCAAFRALPELVAGAEPDLAIGRAEMALLDRPPWSHGDRLLSAFELAHAEIRTQAQLVSAGLEARIAHRAGLAAPAPAIDLD